MICRTRGGRGSARGCYSPRIVDSKPHRARTFVAATSALALALGVCAGTVVVARTEAGERDVESALAVSGGRALQARVEAGSHVFVEICAVDVVQTALPVPVVVEGPSELEAAGIVAVLTIGAVTLDVARRAGRSACWTAYDRDVPRAGVVSAHLADADAESAAALQIKGRIHVRAARLASARPALVLALLGALGLAGALAMRRRAAALEPSLSPLPLPRGPAVVVLIVGVGMAAAAAQAVRYVGDGSALLGLTRGLLLGAAEIGLALALAAWLARREQLTTGDVLGAVPPRGGALSLLMTPAVGALCAIVGVLALRLVPSTGGEAPIEAFVARPSGMLAFALLAVVVPIGEELFFRGLVYGAARRSLGAPSAFVLSAGLFVAAHAPQDWGSWGGLVAVAVVGVVTTALRAATGSVAVPMLAHLVYNGLLAASAL